MNSEKFNVNGSEYSRTSHLFLVVSDFATAVGFVIALIILGIIVYIIELLKKNNENFWLMYVWLFTHICYTLMTFLGVYSRYPRCLLTVVQILETIFTSVLSAVITFLLLMIAYRRIPQPNVRRNRNTTSSEVSELGIGEEIDNPPTSYLERFENDDPPPSCPERFENYAPTSSNSIRFENDVPPSFVSGNISTHVAGELTTQTTPYTCEQNGGSADHSC
jgi:hypothetical protein